MEIEVMFRYISYLMIVIGIMAFLVSCITQVVKTWPTLDQLPTSAVVIVLSLILCPITFIAVMSWKGQNIAWYMIFACIIVSFLVALVAMDGWERIRSIWDRTRFKQKNKEEAV